MPSFCPEVRHMSPLETIRLCLEGSESFVSNTLFRISVVLGLVGIGLGIFMGIRQDFSLMPVHAHLNLLGFVVLFLTALYYRAFPEAAVTRLAKIQAALAVVRAILLPIGIACVTLGDHRRYF